MNNKTIPFSARISVTDAEFISSLEFEGANTPSEKLRALLAQVRQQHINSADYSHNLQQAQALCSNLKQHFLLRQQSLNYSPKASLRTLDALPSLLANLQTNAVRSAKLSIKQLEEADASLVQAIFQLNEALLPLAVSKQQSTQQAHLFELATLLHQYQHDNQEKTHE